MPITLAYAIRVIDKNENGTFESETDKIISLYNSDPLPEDDPQVKMVLRDLGVDSLEGIHLAEAEEYLEHLRQGRANARQGNIVGADLELQRATELAPQAGAHLSQVTIDHIHQNALINGIRYCFPIMPTSQDARGIESFGCLNESTNPQRERSFEDFERSAQAHGFEIFRENRAGDGPSVVIIGWNDHGLRSNENTPDIENGIKIQLETLEPDDIFVPEGLETGAVRRGKLYELNPQVSQFVVADHNSSYVEENPSIVIRSGESAILVGAEPYDFEEFTERFKHLLELADIYSPMQEAIRRGDMAEGKRLFEQYWVKSMEFFPDLSPEERVDYNSLLTTAIDRITSTESDRRDLGFRGPTVVGLAKHKKPNQVIYVTIGRGHLERQKFLDYLTSNGISFIAFVPKQ